MLYIIELTRKSQPKILQAKWRIQQQRKDETALDVVIKQTI